MSATGWFYYKNLSPERQKSLKLCVKMNSVQRDGHMMRQKLSKLIKTFIWDKQQLSCKCRPPFSQSTKKNTHTHIYSSLYTQIHTCIKQIFVHRYTLSSTRHGYRVVFARMRRNEGSQHWPVVSLPPQLLCVHTGIGRSIHPLLV